MSDANGQAVAYTYFRRDENEARQAKVLTWDEARRIAANTLWVRSRNALVEFVVEPNAHDVVGDAVLKSTFINGELMSLTIGKSVNNEEFPMVWQSR